MGHLSDFLRAVAVILWPIIVIWVVIMFKAEIRDMLRRFRRGKLFGQELELDPTVSELSKTVKRAVLTAPIQPGGASSYTNKTFSLVKEVLSEAKNSPKVALMTLWNHLESELFHLMATMDLLEKTVFSASDAILILADKGLLPKTISSSLNQFLQVRDILIHNHGQGENIDNILSAIDSGISILKLVQAIPHETNIVYEPSIEVFKD